VLPLMALPLLSSLLISSGMVLIVVGRNWYSRFVVTVYSTPPYEGSVSENRAVFQNTALLEKCFEILP
jgi:hypothetical protein